MRWRPGKPVKSKDMRLMVDNALKSLRCGADDHAPMTRLLEDHRRYQSGAFTLWVCPDCGMMALHLKSVGDIHWYMPHAKTQVEPHRAGCAYCPERFDCTCANPRTRHMCVRCDDAAEESKTRPINHSDGLAALDAVKHRRETDRAEADDATRDPQGTVDRLAGEDLPW